MTTTDTTTQIPTPRMDKAAGKPSHDWEKTAERLYAERVKLERELHDARRHALNIYQDQCENAYVEVSIADAFRQALAEVAPDHPALKGAPPSYGVWETLSRENEELRKELAGATGDLYQAGNDIAEAEYQRDEAKADLFTAHAKIAGLEMDTIDREQLRDEEAGWMEAEIEERKGHLRRALDVFKRYVQWHGSCLNCHPDDADPVVDAEAIELDRQVNAVLGESPDDWTPTVNIRCETESDGIAGSTTLNVIRVEREDDGSYTAVTDHWPR